MHAVLADEGKLGHERMSVMRHRPQVMDVTHWHNHVEAFLLTEGRIFTDLRGRETEVGAGRIGFFWASYPHRVTRVEAPGDIFIANLPVARFRGWRLSTALRLAVMRGELIIADDAIPYQEGVFSLWLRDLAGPDAGRQDLICDEAANLIRRVDQLGWSSVQASRRHAAPKASGTGERVERMIRFVDEHFGRADLRIDDVAAEARLHPNYAMTVFRQAIGLSIGAYVTHVRLAQAQQLLLTTDRKILSVAAEAGFASLSRFYSIFQAHIGTTPTRYRSGHGRTAGRPVP